MKRPTTSAERRELIHQLLAEEVREGTDEPGDTTLVTSWITLVGVQTMNADEDDDYGWVARVTSYPRPPTYVLEGLIEQDRRTNLAVLLSHAVEDDG